MQKKMRRITIADSTLIHPIQTFGPLVTPRAFSEDVVYNLVRKGYKVDEYPMPTQQNVAVKHVRLTIANFNDPNRFNPEKVAVKPVVSNEVITGTPANGTGSIVNPVAKDGPIDPNSSSDVETSNTAPTAIPVANPIGNAGMTKAERKRLAREQREREAREAAEKAKLAENETVVDTQPTEVTEAEEAAEVTE